MEFAGASSGFTLITTPGLADSLSKSQKEILQQAENMTNPYERWNLVSTKLLTPQDSWQLHKEIYDNNYVNCEVAPTWFPSPSAPETNVGKMMKDKNFTEYNDFYDWSVASPEEFWDAAIKEVGVTFDKPYDRVFELSKGVQHVEYLPGAMLNIATSCFNKRAPDDAALVFACEVDASLKTMTFAELDALSSQVADSLRKPVVEGGLGLGFGDAAGICMPMSPEAVAIYIGIVKAGCAAVSIADSFSAKEIETRMRLSNAKALFTQDVVYRFSKNLPLFERVLHFGDFAKVVILPGRGNELHSSIIPHMRPDVDFSWMDFIKGASSTFETVSCSSDHICNILFSSGTTGEPKAIPWTHATPIKCAVDGFMHQDIKCGEVVAWPTNLGWMMGPWLLFQMINGATIALFGGVTSTDLFCKFVEQANVSMLGVVPSLVKSWWNLNATEKCDWSCVRRFSSSGEASDPTAMQWLMSRANYAPVIEYCGGTEVAGSYLSSTMVQPNVPSMFSTPVLGNNFIIIDHNGAPVDQGEIALIPPALGLSTRLLNRDHTECYFEGMPAGPKGEVLRKHGDEIQRVHWPCGSAYNLPNQSFSTSNCAANSAYYRALGRCDDTMNLGGIKVSSVEIERVCNEVNGVLETAAIAVSPAGGGPSRLIIFAIVHADMQAELTADMLKVMLQQSVKTLLNPLFHVGEVVLAEKLPRTASNKVMRRVIRDEYLLSFSSK
eukprot:CAMPEP_0170407468 /NCGR_PEP_ID=MMETSP0117_2-20130122/28262_1 /TAXON_ID=400756 /ORGANISM="Durinskia baltica, Strain CSIRO CS-38" /LENGTH=721 /DNA_ID=CAMNT_0010664715 /DNA_START=17 /DNA_END=2182 /DNA_ORIENTATION=-